MAFKIVTKLNIRTKLLLLCLTVAAPLLAISSFVIWKEYQTSKSEAKRATSFQAAIAVRSLAHWIKAQEDELQALTSLPVMSSNNLKLIQQIIVKAVERQPNWHDLTLVTTQGKPISSNLPCLTKNPDLLTKQAFFKQILSTGQPAISNYIACPITGKPAVLAGAPVVRNGRIEAVLLASIKPDSILQLFRGLGEASGSVICVTDQNKVVLARTLNNADFVGKDFSKAVTVQDAQKHWRGTLEARGIADETQRAYAYDRVDNSRWLVVIGVPVQAIYGTAQHRLILMLVVAICGMGLSVFLAYKGAEHFTIPINELVREALAVGRGDLSKRVKLQSGDELGLLARAFNQMAINLELNQEHKQMVERISESIRQSLELNDILNTTVKELGTALKASRCCLAVIDQEQRELDKCLVDFDYVWFDPSKLGTDLRNRRIQPSDHSHRLLKRILEQEAGLSRDILDQSAIAPLFGSDLLPEDWDSIKSVIAIPIIIHQRVLGLVLVQQCDVHRTWLQSEIELVEAVARHVALAMNQAKLYEQSKKRAEQEQLINQIVRSVRGSLDLDTILDTVTRELGKALELDRCQIAQPRREGPLVVSHEFMSPGLEPMRNLNIYGQSMNFNPEEEDLSQLSILGLDLKLLKAFSGERSELAIADAPLAVISDIDAGPLAADFSNFLKQVGTKSVITAPLLYDNRLLGVLLVHQVKNKRQWKQDEVSLVAAIANQVSVAISHAQLFAQVRHQAITDGLTELYNHVYLKNRLTEELRRAKRKNTPLSLLMIDLDKLKAINDGFGHPIGDAAICQVAWTLKNLLRSGDTAARYGGEEFSVILPETPLSEAAMIAKRLCQQVNACQVPGLGRISVSIGVASFPHQAQSVEELFEKADKALYSAKNNGRNQVQLCQEDLLISLEDLVQQQLELAGADINPS